MKTAYIFGAGGHVRVILSMIRKKYDSVKLIDILASEGDTINEDEFFENLDERAKGDYFLGFGSNRVRIKLYNRLISLGITPSNCIADNVFIADDAEIGNGVVICPGCVIGSKAVIGNNTIVNTLSSVDHDCRLGNHSQITAGVTLGGGTVIGENCFIGIKSATVPGIVIGDNSVVMAGSMVYKNVPDNVMVGGNPARIMKNL